MSARQLGRSIALQTLFEWDFEGGCKKSDDTRLIVKRNLEEFAMDLTEKEFVYCLVDEILNRQKELDKIIEKAAPEWPISQISFIDRNILRIGLYELLFADRSEVPPRVAINEAIELAKAYGGPNSRQFINGVLGTIYRELGEPDKDEITKKELKKMKQKNKKEAETPEVEDFSKNQEN